MLIAILLYVLLILAVLYFELSLRSATLLLVLAGVVLALSEGGMWFIVLPLFAVLAILNIPNLRMRLFTGPAYGVLRKAMPSMSSTEREALEAGTTWWEKDLFSGAPDWAKYARIDLPQLTADEQAFIDNEVEELCHLLDEWDVLQRQDLSPKTWDFLREKGFFGLIIPKEYGGRDFSPFAQSRVMSKIASRSITAAVTAMVPNSLGPGELLVKYGTQEQKDKWLPGLADGSELPCFGLTGPEAGSDAGAVPDLGVVCRGEFEGQEVVGLRLQFRKRWITLAPVATVVGLAFQLRDPEGLLGDPDTVNYGITCALLPADHPGVEIGRRHDPGAPFMNGPIQGENVFIPVDWIIGGPAMAGKGWRMLIECLGAGRGVSLPALATAAGEMCYLTVGAYARIRRQFNMEVGKFEGVQEATSEIAAGAYMLEAMRQLVTRGLGDGAPSVLTAMAKYHATECMRDTVNHGMDVVSGRAIQQGPRNFLAPVYQALPVAITVEGANILTRSLMIFGQGAMRCHPYLFEELQTLQRDDREAALQDFDPLLLAHLGHVGANTARTLVYGVSAPLTAPVPDDCSTFSRRWYRLISRFSAALALCADVALGVLGGDLKRRELLSARLGDVHSMLFIACSVLKFHDQMPRSRESTVHAEYAVRNALHDAQNALLDFLDNFPLRPLAIVLRVICFPTGRVFKAPSDEQVRQLGALIMEPNPVREMLAGFVYVSSDPEDAVGRVESTFRMLLEVEEPFVAFVKARSKGEIEADELEAGLQEAADKGIIDQADVSRVLEYDRRRYDCLLTDQFDELV